MYHVFIKKSALHVSILVVKENQPRSDYLYERGRFWGVNTFSLNIKALRNMNKNLCMQ